MTETTTYLSCADTAKLVRQALKKAFPTITFRVRSSTYSMGASIRIHWVDGPTTTQVDAVVEHLRGADFNSMEDIKEYRQPIEIDGQSVRPGADFIFTERSHSESFYARALSAACKKWGVDVAISGRMETRTSSDFKGVDLGQLKSDTYIANAGEWLATLVYRETLAMEVA
ncbi:MAG: LPD29 domain-containing protein [Thermoanaerobaculia bacterium]